MSSNKWRLKCRIQKGMFDGEYLVVVNTVDKDGNEVEEAAFIDKEELNWEESPEQGKVVKGDLAISVMGATREIVSVVLPKSTLANGPVVLVKRSDLKPIEEAIAS